MKKTEYSDEILKYLDQKSIKYETVLSIQKSQSGKSLLFKDKNDFRIFTLPTNKSVDNKKIRHILKSQKLRFATEFELLETAGVVSGALPPFGRPLLDIDHYLDKTILKNEYIVFNAGRLDLRIKVKLTDYLSMVNTTLCDFVQEVIE